MSECICSSCKNLKGVMGESGAVEHYECRFGFPSEHCSDCDGVSDNCEAACVNYENDEVEIPAKVVCGKCGRELLQVCVDNGEGEIYCASCYLSGL